MKPSSTHKKYELETVSGNSPGDVGQRRLVFEQTHSKSSQSPSPTTPTDLGFPNSPHKASSSPKLSLTENQIQVTVPYLESVQLEKKTSTNAPSLDNNADTQTTGQSEIVKKDHKIPGEEQKFESKNNMELNPPFEIPKDTMIIEKNGELSH